MKSVGQTPPKFLENNTPNGPNNSHRTTSLIELEDLTKSIVTYRSLAVLQTSLSAGSNTLQHAEL